MGDHKDECKENKFCSKRKYSCCGNHFRTDCLPVPAWVPLTYQAHHLLPCAEVTKFRGRNEKVKKAVDHTKWCVNRRPNMLALPLWAGTLKHYCGLAIGGNPLTPPMWADWPQHTNDHGLYNREVEEALDVVEDAANKNIVEKHDDPSG